MGTWWRRLRGALGLSVVWAGAWAIGELAFVTLLGVFGFLPPLEMALMIAWSGARTGFLSGLVYSAGFAWLNRNRGLSELRGTSSVLMGAAAGSLFPLLSTATILAGVGIPVFTADMLLTLGINVALGVGLGAGTSYGLLTVARSGPDALTGGTSESAVRAASRGPDLRADRDDSLLEG